MPINKPYVFITGAPRSGTSMLTKIIDSHPEIGIFMENIFGLRRRHWTFPDFWRTDEELLKVVESEYAKIQEPIVGNKVCTPDVWNTDEILKMSSCFVSTKVVFIVRNPKDVIHSRLKREKEIHFSYEAKKKLCLDWRDKYYTYLSSWRQSIEVYWKLKESLGEENVHIIYYEDLTMQFDLSVRELCKFLSVDYSVETHSWYTKEHYDAQGKLSKNLKYEDEPVVIKESCFILPKEILNYMNSLVHYKLWMKKEL